ncbi:MAG TPA: hypothetical protein VMC80_01110 [Patescibacteria group bacterium]|nr:hypothetical protein [Patescibacteria group bacterium]
MAKSKFFSVLIILVVIAVIGFFVWSQINPGFNIVNEVLSGSVIGIIVIVIGAILVIAFIRFLRGPRR